MNALTPAAGQSLDARAVAMAHAKHGFTVLPLRLESKIAALKFDKASREPAIVRGLFSEPDGSPSLCNIAIMTGGGLIAVDVDNKGEGARAKLEALDKEFGPLPKTVASRTQSGGFHLLFRVDSGVHVANSQSKIAQGVDIRGEQGYIVGPGSSIEGRSYAWLTGCSPQDIDIKPCPPKLLDALQNKHAKPAARALGEPPEIVGEADTPSAVADAIGYLERDAPAAIEGGNGHKTTMAVAHGVMDRGCSPETAARLMSEHWDERNLPPWGDDALLSFVRSLAPSRQDPIGSKAIGNVFEAVDISAGSGGPRPIVAPKKLYITADEAEALALESSGEYLVKGWLDRQTLSVWFGPPGGGKSAVVLGLAMSIAGGVSWAGCATRRGLVVYIALERAKGMRKRIKAARAKMDLPAGLPFVLLDFRPNLAEGTRGADEVVAAIKAAETQFSAQCELVVIDTVARAMNAADGDKAHEMAAFTNRCARIQDATGAHVLLIHHPSKADPKNARGSGALLGAVDTEVSILNGVIEATKESDNGAPTRLHYSLEGVPVGANKAGEVVTAVFANIGASGVFQVALTQAEHDQFRALEEAQKAVSENGGGTNPPIDKKQWDEAAERLFPHRGHRRTTHDGLRRELTGKGWVAKSPTNPGCFVKVTG